MRRKQNRGVRQDISTPSTALGATEALEQQVRADVTDVLHRPIDSSAQSYFLGQLNSGVSRTNVAKTILGTSEAKKLLVNGYYNHLLHRNPDPSGLSFWTDYLVQGHREDDLILRLVSSQEYFNSL